MNWASVIDDLNGASATSESALLARAHGNASPRTHATTWSNSLHGEYRTLNGECRMVHEGLSKKRSGTERSDCRIRRQLKVLGAIPVVRRAHIATEGSQSCNNLARSVVCAWSPSSVGFPALLCFALFVIHLSAHAAL